MHLTINDKSLPSQRKSDNLHAHNSLLCVNHRVMTSLLQHSKVMLGIASINFYTCDSPQWRAVSKNDEFYEQT